MDVNGLLNGFPARHGGYPKMVGLYWKISLKGMIGGYPYFRKPSYGGINGGSYLSWTKTSGDETFTKSIQEWLANGFGGFLKSWFIDGFSLGNHAASGVPPWLWKPPYVTSSIINQICVCWRFSMIYFDLTTLRMKSDRIWTSRQTYFMGISHQIGRLDYAVDPCIGVMRIDSLWDGWPEARDWRAVNSPGKNVELEPNWFQRWMGVKHDVGLRYVEWM